MRTRRTYIWPTFDIIYIRSPGVFSLECAFPVLYLRFDSGKIHRYASSCRVQGVDALEHSNSTRRGVQMMTQQFELQVDDY